MHPPKSYHPVPPHSLLYLFSLPYCPYCGKDLEFARDRHFIGAFCPSSYCSFRLVISRSADLAGDLLYLINRVSELNVRQPSSIVLRGTIFANVVTIPTLALTVYIFCNVIDFFLTVYIFCNVIDIFLTVYIFCNLTDIFAAVLHFLCSVIDIFATALHFLYIFALHIL